MSRFTADEIALLQALVNHHRMSMGTLLKHPGTELTDSGRAQYEREIDAAERLRDKLTAEYVDATRITEAA